MEKIKLVYTLIPLEKGCVFQILEMSESQRKKEGQDGYDFKSSNGVSIYSQRKPYIPYRKGEDPIIYLRGTSERHDFSISNISFETNKDRDECINKLRNALREWCDRGGFHPVEDDIPNPYPYTYVLEGK